MRIIKIGTWDKNGMPTGWGFDLDTDSEYATGVGMNLLETGEVLVGGIEIVPWTEDRRKASLNKKLLPLVEALAKYEYESVCQYCEESPGHTPDCPVTKAREIVKQAAGGKE